MDSNATRETRFAALQRAKQHNLDVAVIATETVRMILEDAFAVSGRAEDFSLAKVADDTSLVG